MRSQNRPNSESESKAQESTARLMKKQKSRKFRDYVLKHFQPILGLGSFWRPLGNLQRRTMSAENISKRF
jgi:hypothetical protein